MRIFLKNIERNSYFGQLIQAHPELDPHKSRFLLDILHDFEKSFLENSSLKDLVFDHILKHVRKTSYGTFELSGMNLYDPNPEDLDVMKEVYYAGIDPYWLISAQVYKAIVSRDLAKRQSRMSRGVSLRTLEQCAEKIMHNVSVLLINEDMMEGDSSDLACKFTDIFPAIRRAFMEHAGPEIAREIAEDGRLSQDISFAFYWYYMVSCSLVGPDDSEFPVPNTDLDDTWDKIQKMLNSLPANPSEDEFIIFINRFIDLCHGRGSLAGAFVEGGADTCSAVSNMKPDELHESTQKKYTRRQILKTINHWTKILNESF